jgi:RNA polymerase sigma factor (TIGR02999 family)
MSDVTQILSRMESGDPAAAGELLPLVYDELRRLAAAKLALEQPGQTLQATALVHEAYLRLVKGGDDGAWGGRRHFYFAAAEAMQRILVDAARRRKRLKRGGELRRVPLDLEALAAAPDEEFLVPLDEALARFATVDASACELVKLRYFAGLSLKQAAGVLDIPPRTADRLWAYAKAWLLREMRRDTLDAE